MSYLLSRRFSAAPGFASLRDCACWQLRSASGVPPGYGRFTCTGYSLDRHPAGAARRAARRRLAMGLVDPNGDLPGLRRNRPGGIPKPSPCAAGRTTQVAADDVVIANPQDWVGSDPPLASISKLSVHVDVWSYLFGRGLILPLITLDGPKAYAAETPDGRVNFDLPARINVSSPRIGTLRVTDGDAHVVIPRLKLDVRATVATQDEGNGVKLVVDGKGMYAAQPIAVFASGALLSLHDPGSPWPVDLIATNGATHLAIKGTLQNPIALKGASGTVQLSGPDMGLVGPLVGLAIPKTPAYEVASSSSRDLRRSDWTIFAAGSVVLTLPA